MEKDKPYLTVVNETYSSNYLQEFAPLPFYSWDERPDTVELSADEVCTALLLAHGDDHQAAKILKTPFHRFARFMRGSPRCQRVAEEVSHEAVSRAASVAIQTLFDPNADARRLEWASTKVLQMRIAQGHRFSPAPAGSALTANISTEDKTINIFWGNPPALDGPSASNHDGDGCTEASNEGRRGTD